LAKKKTESQNKKPKQVKVTEEQVLKLTEVLEASNLDTDTQAFFSGLLKSNRWLIQQLEEGKLSIRKLQKIFGVNTEPNEKYKERKDRANKDQNKDNPEKKGHGKNHSDEYTGAEEIEVKHEQLNAGDPCPIEDCSGKLYSIDPGVVINITGSPIASAKKYLIEKLRCALCGTRYAATPPEDMDPKRRYDEKFAAMLMINKYFMAVPFFRQQTLQEMLGIPLPIGTQWDIIKSYEPVLKVVYNALLKDGANADGFHIDDTSAKILEIIKERNAGDRKSSSCFTTGIVTIHDDHKSTIYLTNDATAGKTLAPLWAYREEGLPTPFIMSDALTANIPNDIEEDLYLLCYCLVHARRNFYSLGDGYDDLADTVIDLISEIYDNESQTKNMSANKRLAYHQEHSQPVMTKLKQHLKKYQKEFEPNSSAGKAIQYMMSRWTELTQFLKHPKTPIDNNIAERVLKLPIRNRKSAMFYKTLKSALLASYVQSLLFSAAQNNINPFEYMKEILVRKDIVKKSPTKWLPWKYLESIQALDDSNFLQEDSS
jgi:transposase